MHQISSELPEFCRRYYKKHFGLFFFLDTVYVLCFASNAANEKHRKGKNVAEKLFTMTETVKIESCRHVKSESCVSRTLGVGVNAKLEHLGSVLIWHGINVLSFLAHEILKLCDQVRDDILPNLGVRLEDHDGTSLPVI